MIAFSVPQGSFLSRFLCSPVLEKPFQAEPMPVSFPGYRPGVSTKDGSGKELVSPSKAQYIAKGEFLSSSYPEAVEMDRLYWPQGTDYVDFSGMWVYPASITFYAKALLVTDKAREARFTLSLSGAVKVWLNREEVFSFAPYEANIPRMKSFTCSLREGQNELLVGLNDYGERNIMLRFSLRNDGEDLSVLLPAEADPELFESSAALFQTLFLDKLSYRLGEEVRIKSSSAGTLSFTAGGKALTLSSGEVLWGSSAELGAGYREMALSFTAGGLSLSRKLPFEVYDERLPEGDPKEAYLSYYRSRERIDTEGIIARLSGGLRADLSSLSNDLEKIERRADCADFRLLRSLWIYSEYRSLLPPEVAERLRKAILGFRYWFDEKGNDAMWFYSENHALSFHTDELIAGLAFPDEVFPNSGLTGSEHAAKARGLLRAWFEKLFTTGYNEWNSINYIPVDMVSYLVLYKLSPEEEFRGYARKALDLTFSLFADISFKGFLNGSSGRSYDKDLLFPRTHQTNALSYIVWGKGALVPSPSALLLSLTDYEAPPDLRERALCSFPGLYFSEQRQGAFSVRTTVAKSRFFILSTSSSPREGMPGSQETLFNAMLSDPSCRFFINHPGERRVWGTRRPGYFNGNGLTPKVTQHGESALLSYRFEAFKELSEAGYTHLVADFDAFDEVIRDRQSLTLRKGAAFAYVYARNGIEDAANKALEKIELVSPGLDNFWYVRLSSSDELPFSCFAEKMRALPIKETEEEVIVDGFSFPLLPPLEEAYGLSKGSYIRSALVSSVRAEEHKGEREAYRKGERTTPQRRRYIKRGVFPEPSERPTRLLQPLEGKRLDLSGFYMRPSVVSFSSGLFLRASKDGDYRFTLSTENAVRIAINNVEVFSDTTLERNRLRSLSLSLHLLQGWNRVSFFFHDYAERDTRLGFSLRYDGESPLMAGLEKAAAPEELSFLKSLSLPALSFRRKEDVYLEGKAEGRLQCTVSLAFTDSHVPFPPERKAFTVSGDARLPLSGLIGRKAGLMEIRVETASGLERVFQASFSSEEAEPPRLSSIKERKRVVLSFLSENGIDNFQRILCMNATGRSDWRDIFEKEMERLERHFDCSDFRVPAVIFALCRQRGCFSKEETGRMERFLLSFRYWWDEKGDDVMWFFSENHALLFSASAFLSGQLFPDRTFASGLRGLELKSKAKGLLLSWFEDFRRHGYREWNSSVYIPIDVIALTALYELSEDGEVRALAKEALDRTFRIIAVNSYKGVMASSAGRIYFRNLTGRRVSEASALSYIAFGEGWLNQHTFSTALLALSSWEPEEGLGEYASPEEPVLFSSQGFLKAYKSPSFILSSAENSQKGIKGYQELMAELMVGDIDTAIWVTHPGEAGLFGSGRPGYFTGNGTVPCVRQEGSRVYLDFSIPEDQLPFTHAYVPLALFDEHRLYNQDAYFKKGGAFVHIYARNGLERTSSGPFKDMELISPGRENSWLITACDRHPEWSLDRYIAYEEGREFLNEKEENLLKEVSYE